MSRGRFLTKSDARRAYSRRTVRANGALRDAGPQAAGIAYVCVAVLAGGCASASPDGPRPTPIPAEPVNLDASTTLPEPGVELRSVRDRLGFDVEHYDLVLELSEPESGELDNKTSVRSQ